MAHAASAIACGLRRLRPAADHCTFAPFSAAPPFHHHPFAFSFGCAYKKHLWDPVSTPTDSNSVLRRFAGFQLLEDFLTLLTY